MGTFSSRKIIGGRPFQVCGPKLARILKPRREKAINRMPFARLDISQIWLRLDCDHGVLELARHDLKTSQAHAYLFFLSVDLKPRIGTSLFVRDEITERPTMKGSGEVRLGEHDD